MSEDALLVQLRTLELRLLDPQQRADVQVLEALLDPAFVEFGTSGRRYTRSEVIAALRAPGVAAEYCAEDFECARLAPDLAQVRYRSVERRQGVERQALRSSLWRSNAAGWQLLFHQGTLFTENAAS
ncbi:MULTISPECIES: nuclear transport factor 2 family protein [Xanthomonas]|uniref:nuclear transport factor 2 family protein n=1 Tax=Xanthomonas TaxID=338 RepID=UPI001ADA6742|nr:MULTISPECIES: nuclear transport factor 2 family protein [Xanthomonas]MBO9855397.1 nuclear transport factor 2 family protein [Xanthomonas sp. A1809]MBV6864127.1 nuclear transport factor 2 family protein [Xanthomonas campestris pv. coriandri]MBV6871825.1 nuclear transport factor 2 family protein [Xanthomonas campestris pv. veroniae]MBV6883576.1 nuclear transport factor 2 family protein [Xanthomonas campestris pv. euphorbiae]MBV6887543.1 nuclear transport factor 2 family protein [Xanthomonas c